jgi:hypothetical protein
VIIDPYPSPVLQRTDMHEVPYALGIIDQNNMNQIASLEQICQYDQTHNITRGQETCSNIMDYIQEVSGNILDYNVRDFD